MGNGGEDMEIEVEEIKTPGESTAVRKRWEDMDTDVLVKIFKVFNMVELSPVSQVCRLWRSACSDPLLWNTLGLGLLKSNFILTRAPPYIWVDERSDKRLMKILRLAMALSCSNVTCMILHFNLFMKDEHLSYLSERTPHLRRLVMPAWNRLTKNGICQALRRWKCLESMTVATIEQPPHVLDQLSRSCKKFSELKIMGTLNETFASSIVWYLPRLKVLSLRCSRVILAALRIILNLENLEVLNISHCMIMGDQTPQGRRQNFVELTQDIREKASQLREFYHCQSTSCVTCQRMRRDDGLMRWYRYEEWSWRRDEVHSLDVGSSGNLFDEECDKLTASS